MKLYKFRSVINETDLTKVREIIETGEFWCSKFHQMNDPMEGVYYTVNPLQTDKILSEKNKRKICSFSSIHGFHKPCMWGYYTNGFQGIAIEIEIEKKLVYKVQYDNDITSLNDMDKILTTKLKSWKHENEYRFIKVMQEEENKCQIGKITKVYFGSPYAGLTNSQDIINDNNAIQKYHNNCKVIQDILDNKGIPYSYVHVEKNQVKEILQKVQNHE